MFIDVGVPGFPYKAFDLCSLELNQVGEPNVKRLDVQACLFICICRRFIRVRVLLEREPATNLKCYNSKSPTLIRILHVMQCAASWATKATTSTPTHTTRTDTHTHTYISNSLRDGPPLCLQLVYMCSSV